MRKLQQTFCLLATAGVLLTCAHNGRCHEGHVHTPQPVIAQADTKSARQAPTKWYKGNTHCHTSVVKGADSPPEEVAKWYHDRGYNFLGLSEHNVFVDPATVKMPENKRDDFILIPTEEITGARVIHTTALNIKSLVDWKFTSEKKSEIIQNHVDGAHGAEGVPILNHPNFRWAVSADDMLPVKGLHLFELYNGHPSVNNFGDAKRDSTEQIWDKLLTAGMLIYAVASDDAHVFQKWTPSTSNPGRGWVMVRAAELTPNAITHAIHHGNFYASSGIILSEVSTTGGTYIVVVDDAATAAELTSPILMSRKLKEGSEGFSISFIGPEGKVLQTTQGTRTEFKIDPKLAYVRCKVTFGRKVGDEFEEFAAWTQPVFNGDRATAAHVTTKN